MTDRWVVHADHVWKRYCRTMRRSVRYALVDGVRAFTGLPPSTGDLREDEFWSLRDISFQLAPGEALALVGTNGAGKSTLLKILSGVFAPDRGELRVRGRIVSMMMAGVGFHPILTGRENIFIYGSLLGMRRREIQRRIPAMLDFADLSEFIDTPVKYYSTGMYMRLAFSIAAQSQPDVFVIDEVLAVGDVAFRTRCIDHLHTMKSAGCALLLVSHSAGHLRALADHGIWLHRGQCLASGPIENVLDRYLDEQHGGSPPPDRAPAPPEGAAPRQSGIAVATSEVARNATGATPRAEIELVHPSAEPAIVLTANASTRLTLRLRASDRCLEPTITVAFEIASAVVAGAALTLATSTFPQMQADRALKLDFDLHPHLAAADGDLVVHLTNTGDDGSEQLLATRRWPCKIVGRPAGAGPLDLQEELTWQAEAGVGPTAPPATEAIVDPGCAIPIVWQRVDDARAWLVLDATDRPIARMALPPPPAAATMLTGRFRAHLPAGTYQQALETGAGLMRGARFQIRETTEPVGHADLDASCHIVAVASTPEATPPASGVPIRFTELQLDGDTRSLDELLGVARRLHVQPRRSAETTTVLATGERCRLRLQVVAAAAFTEWDISIGFGHAERGRCAGMRLRRPLILEGPGTFDVCFEFAAHLARGEYLLGCSAVARDAAGGQVEMLVPDFARCFVLGPGETGSEGSLQVAGLEAQERPAAPAPESRAEAADLDGSALRLLAFGIDGRGGTERTVLPAHTAAIAQIDVLATDVVEQPSFKFAFLSPSQRCVARMTGFEDRHPLAPLPAGHARTYRMHFTPHLSGGCYQVQVALMQRSAHEATVTDRLHQGAVCLVPARTRPTGPGLLAATVLVDLD